MAAPKATCCAAMLVMLGASVGGWWLAGGLTRSLTWLMHSVNRVAEGQPAASLPQQGAMEVVALSQAVTQMAHSLQARADERAALLEREQQARAAAEAATARTERLQRLTAALGAALSPAEVAQIILHQGLPAVGASAGAIALRSNDGASLEMLQVLGYPEELIAPWQHVPLSSATPFAEVVRTGQPVLLESRAEGVLRYPALAAGEAVFGNGAIAAFPLVVRDEVIGGLGFSFAQPRVFSEEELAFATSLVQQCAQALERARLYAAEQRARAEAQEAVRVRDAFLSVAAHELRTPLTALLGNAQLAARRAAQGEIAAERQQRALSSVVEQAARLNRMIAALLDVSQLETGQLQVALAPMDMVALLRSVRAESEPTLQAHRLICELPAEPLLIAGDELRLRQVLENLIGNAVKYSPRGGSVTVWAERREAQVCVSVRDEGIGIPADAIPRLFQRFFRVGNGEARRISGIGVGLYVVREIVALHGGTVEVQSSEGQGSTFTIALPALRELERPL
jgi:signal transduction histidine kinase